MTSKNNVLSIFAKWLQENKLESYIQYLGKTVAHTEARLREIAEFFPERNIFEIEDNDPTAVIEFLKHKTNNKERKNNPDFVEYDTSHSNGIPKAIIGKNHYFKFLENYYSKADANYWLFQGSPEIYNITNALKAGHLKSWKVVTHKDSIKPDDKVILWQAGVAAGCYALAKVTSDVEAINQESFEKQYFMPEYQNTSEEKTDRVLLQIEHYMAEDPVLWKELKHLPDFQNFNAGNQGTNFKATKKEYETILSLFLNKKSMNQNRKVWAYAPGEQAVKWDEFYEKGIIGIGWDDLGDLRNYKNKSEITSAIKRIYPGEGSRKNDSTANHEFVDIMKPGDLVIAKTGRSTLLGYGFVTSDYYFDIEAEDYKHRRKIDWKLRGEWTVDFQIVLKTLTDITIYKTDDGSQLYSDYLLGVINSGRKKEGKLLKKTNVINQILYGPPGTGKTYKLQKEYFPLFTVAETSLSRKQYLENLLADKTWWQVISLAVLDLKLTKVEDILQHELVQIKVALSNSNNPRPTIWGRLQAHTVEECPNVNVRDRSEPRLFFKNEQSQWSIIEENLTEFYPEAYDLLEKSKNFEPKPNKQIKNYEFITFHQSFSYEDFIEGIKPKLDDEEAELSYEITDGVFKKMALRASADPENKYAIFIDEINRGNVSAIFGELITLIEDDKRSNGENPLSVKLPYSKKTFEVPSNLYIFGTMNTADRSVEALDTALRRRFNFVEIMPLPELLENIEFDGFNLKEVLTIINDRIEFLLDRDHTIGHSYFMKLESGDTPGLQMVFENKVIPLLQEYFYHDYEKIALILGPGFVRVTPNHRVSFPKFDHIPEPDGNTLFQFIKPIDDIEVAVQKLIGNENA